MKTIIAVPQESGKYLITELYRGTGHKLEPAPILLSMYNTDEYARKISEYSVIERLPIGNNNKDVKREDYTEQTLEEVLGTKHEYGKCFYFYRKDSTWFGKYVSYQHPHLKERSIYESLKLNFLFCRKSSELLEECPDLIKIGSQEEIKDWVRLHCIGNSNIEQSIYKHIKWEDLIYKYFRFSKDDETADGVYWIHPMDIEGVFDRKEDE